MVQDEGAGFAVEKVRRETLAEIEAMVLYLLADGRSIGEEAASNLSQLERGVTPLGDLVTLHGRLSRAIAPAKPRSILSLQEGEASGRLSNFLGPTPGVRRLTAATVFFALAFFLISLSGEINLEAMSKSIYELNGGPLAIKLGLIVSAAGLGASFSALFSVWDDLRKHRYNPRAESETWMHICLGIVAGLMLAEIIAVEQVLMQGEDAGSPFGGMSEPLLALLGGFSAGVIHMVLDSIVNALKRALTPEHARQPPLTQMDQNEDRMAQAAAIDDREAGRRTASEQKSD